MRENTEDPPKRIRLRSVDKVIGAIASIPVVGGALAALVVAIPLIIPLFASLAFVAALALGTLVVMYFLINAATAGTLGRAYRMAVSQLGLALVRFNPAHQLSEDIGALKGLAGKYRKHQTEVRSAVRETEKALQETTAEQEAFMEQASDALESENPDEHTAARLASRADRRKGATKNLNEQIRLLHQLEEVLGARAQSAEDDADDAEDEMKMLLLGDRISEVISGASRSAVEALGDDPALLERHRVAVSTIQQRIDMRLAEVEVAMDKTNGVLASIDVKKRTLDKKALASVLEFREQKSLKRAESEAAKNRPPPLPKPQPNKQL